MAQNSDSASISSLTFECEMAEEVIDREAVKSWDRSWSASLPLECQDERSQSDQLTVL